MRKRKKIGIDLDSTLNNLNEVWLDRYNEDYNDNLKHFKKWDATYGIKSECDIKIYDYLKESGFFYNLDIQPNARRVVDLLSKKYDLYIVTAYQASTCVDKTNWIMEHLPSIDVRNIIFCNNKSVLNLDYLIDDGPHNILGFKQVGVIFDMEYNQHIPINEKRFRVKNWNEIEKLFLTEILKGERMDKWEKVLGENINNHTFPKVIKC